MRKIEDIQNKHGLPTFTAAVHFAIAEAHKSEFKDYVMARQNRGGEEVSKKQQSHDKQVAVCDALNGVLETRGDVQYCVYYTYNRKNRYEQEVPLADLTDSLIDKQYFPSREEVEKLQASNKVNYGVENS